MFATAASIFSLASSLVILPASKACLISSATSFGGRGRSGLG